jgi:hypothetical protein
MRIERVRERLASLQPEEMESGWWYAALWIPMGYASSRLFGEVTPVLVVGCLAGATALVHRLAPGAVEVVAGLGALVVGVNTAASGDCHDLVGEWGVAVLTVFGGAMVASAMTRLLGSASIREAARHLLIAVMALELSLAVVTPVGETVDGFAASVTTAVVLAVLLLVVTLVGVRATLGPPLLAVTLAGTQAVLAVTGGPCHGAAARAVLGTAVFTALAVYLGTRPLPFGYEPGDEDDETHSERWAGDYEDHRPL